MAEYQILYWHDIPVQVRAGGRRDRVTQELASRFQVAVDNAAMAANLIGADQYLEEFHWSERQQRDGSPAEVVAAVVAELEERYATVPWRQTVESLQAGKEATTP